MTVRVLAALKADAAAEPDMATYDARLTRTCECGLAFSAAVAVIHGQRTGHRIRAAERMA